MANFFVGNGFQSIIDQGDYTQPKFIGSWGVSDEDLSRTDKQPENRAMMQFGDNYGWLENDILTVLQVNKPAKQYRYIPKLNKQKPIKAPLNPEQLKKIKAFAMLPSILYQSRGYYVPQD